MRKFRLYLLGISLLFISSLYATTGTETFEVGARTPNTKTAYALGNVYGFTYQWSFSSALIGTSTVAPGVDRFNFARSARIQSTGSITMIEDKIGGLGTVTISHAKFGNDGTSTWRMDVSDDGGITWVAYTSATVTTSTTTLTPQSFTVNVPGDQIRIRIVKLTTSATSNRLNIDDITLTDFSATQTISAPTFTGSPFCITTSTGAPTTVSFTTGGAGVFNAGNVFTAQLSNAAGSFATPVDIGNITAINGATPISAIIPAGTATGNGYKIRVVSTDPVITSSTSATSAVIQLNTPDASGISASVASSTSLTVSWSNPTLCYDEVMLIASTAAVIIIPSGDGTTYTPASLAYGSPGYNFTGFEYLVYKGLLTTATVTSLITNTTYYFKLFVRKGTVWSDGITINATPTNDQTGDFRTTGNATWGAITNWERFSGTWVTATSGQSPGAATGGTVNVTIRNSNTVTLDAGYASNPIGKLTVDLGGKLYTNQNTTATANRYISVWGDILCNGTIGNGSTYDVISFNTDGVNQSVSGTGVFSAARIRKNTSSNPITNLSIAMNVSLMFAATGSTSGTEIYNAQSGTPAGDSKFNVTVNENSTLDLQLAPASSGNTFTAGNLSIDGLSGEGVASNQALQLGGTFTINGTLNVPGNIYAYTHNINPSYPIKFIVGTNGIINCLNVVTACNFCNALLPTTGSAPAGSTIQVLNGGKINLNGGTGTTYTSKYTALTNVDPNYNQSFSIKTTLGAVNPSFISGLGTTNTVYDFQSGSTIEYSNGIGSMVVWPTSAPFIYSNLLCSGSGTKTYSANITALKNVTITTLAVLTGGVNNINVGGDWNNYGTGGFTEGTGIVNFNGTSAQNLYCPLGENFNKVTFSGTGIKTLHDNIIVASDLTINAGSGALIPNSNTISVAGNWTNTQGTSGFTEGVDKVVFNGAAAQTINTTGGETFYDLNIKNSAVYPVGVTLGSNVNIDIASSGTLYIETGHLDAGTNTLDGPGNLSMNATTNLTLSKNGVTLPELSGTYSLTGGAVIFNGTGAQTIRAVNYFDITSSSTGTRILPTAGTVGVANIFTPFTNSYTFTSSTVDYNGSGDQNIAPFTAGPTIDKTYNNLTISNAGIKSLTGATDVEGALTLNSTTELAIGNNFLNLKSTATKTARVAPVSATAIISYVTGSFVVERYFPARRAWRLITAPVTVDATKTLFNSWQVGGASPIGSGTYISGPGETIANGLDVTPQHNFSLKTFNQATSAFDGVPDTKANRISGTLGIAGTPDNIGYFMFVRGDRTPANVDAFNPYGTVVETTLRDTGKIQVQSYTFPANPSVLGYTLIGNPYASPVDFASLSRSGVANKFQAWDPKLNTVGGYVVVDLALGFPTITTVPVAGGSTTQTQIIQSKQAFLVQTTNASSPTVTFAETAKSATNNLTLFRPVKKPVESLAVNLYTVKADGNTILADGVLAQYSKDFSDGIDQLDALKFGNINETFSIASNNTYFMLQRRSPLTVNDTIFLSLKKARQLKYRFNFIATNLFENHLAGYLEDTYLKTSRPINMQGNTWVDFEVTATTASAAANRFRIVFKKPCKFGPIKADIVKNDVGVEWLIENENEISGYEVERSTDAESFTKEGTVNAKGKGEIVTAYNWLDVYPAPGVYYYRIKGMGINGAIAYSEIVKVKIMNAKNGMYVYPNPVSNGELGLQMNRMLAGTYSIRLLNNNGQVLQSQRINHAGGTASVNINYPKQLSGNYQLEIVAPDKKKVLLPVLIQ